MPVLLQFGSDARRLILEGAELLSKAVVSTLGPWGRNVAIRRPPVPDGQGGFLHRPPMITKDGVTVARNFTSLKDPFQDKGVQIVKEAAERTNRLAGDGTTTATLLAYEMMRAGEKLLNDGANAMHVRRGMNKAAEAVIKSLESMRRDVKTIEDFAAIATISSQDENIGALVATVIDEVGKDGAVTIKQGMGAGMEYEVTSGLQISTGYASHYFAGKNGVATIDDPYILVTTEKIVSIRDLLPILEEVSSESKESGKPATLVIFAEGVEGDALVTLVKNHVENPKECRFLVLKPPFYGSKRTEALEDIAIATGATLIDRKKDRTIEDMGINDLGHASRVIATLGVTTIVECRGKAEEIEQRTGFIKKALEETTNDGDVDYLKMRLANMSGKVATISVGGSSQTEQIEKQHRVEDAIAATRAAHETGILPGGGVAYLRCLDVFDEMDLKDEDENAGAGIVESVMEKQLWWVAKNAGEDPDEVIAKIKTGNMDNNGKTIGKDSPYGFNAETGEYGDMFQMKVIDPCKVPVTALRNAVSVAGMFLTLEVSIVEDEVPMPKNPA